MVVTIKSIGIMKKLLYLMVTVGIVIGLIFPYFIQEFVTIEVDYTFRIACIVAGLLVGILNYWLIKVALEDHLSPIINTAKAIANGTYELDIKSKDYKNDILGELYKSIVSMSSALKETHEQLIIQANVDSLTNLYNRTYFNDKLSTLSKKGCKEKVALLYLDLDNFKIINDTYGHSTGDRSLQIVAERLLSCVRANDIIVRMGGDEFTIILPDVKEETYIDIIAQRVLEKVSEPMLICNKSILITVSIGIGIYPTDGKDIQSLLKNADTAMYSAKKNNQGYLFYRDIRN